MFEEFQLIIDAVGFIPFVILFAALMMWSFVWKGLALWKAARNGHNVWYIVMLLVNTIGILEIIYIYFFSKKKENTHL